MYAAACYGDCCVGVTWSVGERVTGCESAQGMGPVGRVGTDRRAKPLGCENFCFLGFLIFIKKS